MCPLSSRDVHRKHFRISGGQPGRLGCGGRGKTDMNTMLPYSVNNLIQPFEIVYSLVRLQLCPGEHRQRQQVNPCPVEKPHILIDSLRIPLIWIIIAAIVNFLCFFHLTPDLPVL